MARERVLSSRVSVWLLRSATSCPASCRAFT